MAVFDSEVLKHDLRKENNTCCKYSEIVNSAFDKNFSKSEKSNLKIFCRDSWYPFLTLSRLSKW